MFCALYCLYIILLLCSFSSFIYIIKNMIHIPHYTYFFPLNKKSGYSHLSTRSIHLLLCILYKLRFTEGTEQSNLLQCLCNAKKTIESIGHIIRFLSARIGRIAIIACPYSTCRHRVLRMTLQMSITTNFAASTLHMVSFSYKRNIHIKHLQALQQV